MRAQPGWSGHTRGAKVSESEPLPTRTIGRAAAVRYNQMERAAG